MEIRSVTLSGLALAVISSFFFSLSSLAAKYLDLPPVQLSWFGFLGLLTISAPIALKNGNIFPKNCIKLFLLRSVVGSIFLIMSFYSVELIPLGDASVLFFTTPVFTLVLASIYLREPFTIKSIVTVIVIMCGIVLVTRPPFIFSDNQVNNKYLYGVLMALFASLSEAIGNVILRELNSKLHFSVITFNHGLISFFLTTFLLIHTGWETPEFHQILLILFLSLITSIEQICMALALTTSQAGPVALVQASDILFGYIFQIVFFKEKIEFISVIGALIIALMVFKIASMKSSVNTIHSLNV